MLVVVTDNPTIEHVPTVDPDVWLEIPSELEHHFPRAWVVQGDLMAVSSFITEVQVAGKEEPSNSHLTIRAWVCLLL